MTASNVHPVNTQAVSFDDLGELIERRQRVVLRKIATRHRRMAALRDGFDDDLGDLRKITRRHQRMTALQAEIDGLRDELVNVRDNTLFEWAGIDVDEDEEAIA